MMHVLIAENLLDHDYIARYTLGFEQLKARAAEWTPERAAETCGITRRRSGATGARLRPGRAAAAKPVAIRVNYGVQRVRGGGMAVRTIACLPALVGAWRHAAGGIQLSSSGSFPGQQQAALQRPDLLAAARRAPST